MAQQVVMPKKKSDGLAEIGMIGGGIAGAFAGAPIQGAMAGRSIGGFLESQNQGPEVQAVQRGQVTPVVNNQQGGLDTLLGAAGAAQGASDFGNMNFSQGGAATPQGGGTNMAAPPTPQPGAMERRQESLNNDPLYALTKAQKALAFQPPEVRKQYEPVVNQALIQAQRDRKRNDYGSIG